MHTNANTQGRIPQQRRRGFDEFCESPGDIGVWKPRRRFPLSNGPGH